MTDQRTDLSEQPSAAKPSVIPDAVSDLEAVLRTPQGRRTLLRILGRCGLYGSPYTGQEAATNFRLGAHNLGLWLVSQLDQVGPTEYPRLLLEAAQRADLNKETVHVVDEE